MHPIKTEVENPKARRCVFLDRDGVLNVERHYLSDPKDVELLPGVIEGLRQLQALGLYLVVVTNQSGIGRGYFELKTLDAIHGRLESLLARGGVHLDGIYYCPHHPADGCRCRKPNTLLAERAANDLGFSIRESFMVGDKPCDIEFGNQISATTFLVTTGYGREVLESQATRPDYAAADLIEVASLVKDYLAHELAAS